MIMGGNYQEVNEETKNAIVQMLEDLNKVDTTTPQIIIGLDTMQIGGTKVIVDTAKDPLKDHGSNFVGNISIGS